MADSTPPMTHGPSQEAPQQAPQEALQEAPHSRLDAPAPTGPSAPGLQQRVRVAVHVATVVTRTVDLLVEPGTADQVAERLAAAQAVGAARDVQDLLDAGFVLDTERPVSAGDVTVNRLSHTVRLTGVPCGWATLLERLDRAASRAGPAPA